ncbi:unnamed protein product [Blepharisma stoltei]|uniref:KHDC4/BBP-like KH-domain type I domain-containing protein n=1 Tax=Blepharisma stoltei TaxID=1481888 RepID=A0AAU9I6U9_9CILI|nr:unnamed protein product [Blepharisma stoltei]
MQSKAGDCDSPTLKRSKIHAMLQQPDVRDKVLESLASLHIPSHTPCLKLEIAENQGKRFSMEQSDVTNVFEEFGEIQSLRVFDNIALVLYKDIVSAYFAQKVLDGRQLPGFNVVLQVSWYHNQDEASRIPLQDLSLNTPEIQQPVKYTCRFDIQIENDKEFQVARRLIGPRGSNMKKIVERCCKGAQGQAHDIIKLRLRGRGSGFKEGPDKEESDETLHMCISSKFEEKYEIAVNEVEKLINQVYAEYKDYCLEKGRPDPQLKAKKIENISGRTVSFPVEKIKEIEELDSSEIDIAELIDIRNEARRQCNFQEADRIREILRKKGVILTDEKGARGRGNEVTSWKHKKN